MAEIGKYKDWLPIYDEMPKGWKVGEHLSNPLFKHIAIWDGKSVLKGGKQALLKLKDRAYKAWDKVLYNGKEYKVKSYSIEPETGIWVYQLDGGESAYEKDLTKVGENNNFSNHNLYKNMNDFVAKYKRGNVVMIDGAKTKVVDYEYKSSAGQFSYLLENGVEALESELSKPKNSGKKAGDKTTATKTPKQPKAAKFSKGDTVGMYNFVNGGDPYVGKITEIRAIGSGHEYRVEGSGKDRWVEQKALYIADKSEYGNARKVSEVQKTMKKFLSWEGKTKSREELNNFLIDLNTKANTQVIRKTHKGAEYVQRIINWLVRRLNGLKAGENSVVIKFGSEQNDMKEALAEMEGSTRVFHTLEFAKRVYGIAKRTDIDVSRGQSQRKKKDGTIVYSAIPTSRQAAQKLIAEIDKKIATLSRETVYKKYAPLFSRLRTFANGGSVLKLTASELSGLGGVAEDTDDYDSKKKYTGVNLY